MVGDAWSFAQSDLVKSSAVQLDIGDLAVSIKVDCISFATSKKCGMKHIGIFLNRLIRLMHSFEN